MDEINAILKSYDPEASMTGEAALTKDLIDIADGDFRVTSYISIAAIFIIIAITFRSISVPVILVAAIELAIFINKSVPYFGGGTVPFVAPTIIGCVQLGATVDYAILLTTRFREELQRGENRTAAILTAASASDSSIITSAMVLFLATLGVGLISKIEIISSICIMLARGSVISALCILFLLPAILYVCEPVINKTSLHWRVPAPPKERRAVRAAKAVKAKAAKPEKPAKVKKTREKTKAKDEKAEKESETEKV